MAFPARNPLDGFVGVPDGLPGETSIDQILDAVRDHLGMEIAFASRFVSGRRQFTHIRSDLPLPVGIGDSEPTEETLCHMVREGLVPELIHDARALEAAQSVPIVMALPVGSHLNVPLRLSDGTVYGSFCCLSRTADRSLNERDIATLRAFADLAARQVERELAASAEYAIGRSRIGEMLSGQGPAIVHQPIHRIDSGEIVGVECLARFPDRAVRGPDQWFAEAASVGLGVELELMAFANALATLSWVPGDRYLAINVSPEAVTSGALEALLEPVPAGRVVIEVTEHARVRDYAALKAALAPLRAKARIAIDDVGAGYAGLRHIVDLAPDILKLDMSLTRDIAADPARRALAHALVRFAHEMRCAIVAEGVETEAERAALAGLGVPLAQGYLFSRPMPVIAAQQAMLGISAEAAVAAAPPAKARRA